MQFSQNLLGKVQPSEWSRRRRVLYLCLLLLGGSLIYVLVPGGDAAVDQTAVLPLVGGIVGLVTTYVFGAVQDDKNRMNAQADAIAPTPEGEH